MRYLFALMLGVWPAVVSAQVWEDQKQFGPETAPRVLRVLSSTDTSFFAPILEAFLQDKPDLQVA